jgi:hypothetical protein
MKIILPITTTRTGAITRRAALAAVLCLPTLALAHGGLEHVVGVVASVSPASVTVKTAAGKTVEVLLDSKTAYSKAAKPIARETIQPGDRVVIHAAETGNKLTARTVEIGVAPAAKKAAP